MGLDSTSPTLMRLLGALLALVAGCGAYRLLNAWLLRRARRRYPLLPKPQRGAPALLYFSTPECQPCKSVQKPAIQRLQELIGEDVQVMEVNAAEDARIAAQWGVLSVPTTFIIDAQGRPRFVNHGVASTEKLLRQILKISGVKNDAKHSHSKPLT